MTNKQIGAAAGFYPAGEARFTISLGLQILQQRLLPSGDWNTQPANGSRWLGQGLPPITVLGFHTEPGGSQ
jgi:hypothetical protein